MGGGRYTSFIRFIPEWNESDASLREKRQSLAVQPTKWHNNPETFAVRKIEGDNLVPGDATEIAIGTKTKAARLAKFGRPFGTKDAHKMSIRGVVFANSRDGNCRDDPAAPPGKKVDA